MKEALRGRITSIGLAGILAALLVIYLSTLQVIPNGSSHYYMIDVGETQIVLNEWGTLHATGYPLYVMTGSLLTDLMTAIGVDAVVAPTLVSLLWTVMALAIFYTLGLHLTGRWWLAAGITLLFGLTRTVWIHAVVAEIYSFGLVILLALLALGLWRSHVPGRIYWMALLGGIGVAHHRALALAIPALLYAVWPRLTTDRRRFPRMVGISLLLGLLGFAQYAYLYLRARDGADWVYGEPGTLEGLWVQFTGLEASRFVGPPESFDALVANFNTINAVLVRDLTVPGLLAGILGLVMATRSREHHRAGVTFFLLALAAYGFHLLFYSDVLSALILSVTAGLVFGWLFLAEALWNFQARLVQQIGESRHHSRPWMIPTIMVFTAMVLIVQNRDFIDQLTSDPTGLETIEQVSAAPPGSTVMLAWGPRYFAAAFAHDVRSELQHITLVDHKADFAAIAERGMLVTPEYTFYNQSIAWWEDRLGARVYLWAAAPYLVEIGTQPELADDPPDGITVAAESVVCEENRLVLEVVWQTADKPQEDLSVFVHALDAAGNVVAQGDQAAPVYGWRPLTTWLPGEQVRDLYPVEADPAAVEAVRYGLYRALPGGGFENVSEYTVVVMCDG